MRAFIVGVTLIALCIVVDIFVSRPVVDLLGRAALVWMLVDAAVWLTKK